jgi:hypothetical protein
MKDFKIRARYGTTCSTVDDGDLFDWQYIDQMLGRYDHVEFADLEDLQERLDFEGDNVVRNVMSTYRGEFDLSTIV